MKSQYPFSMCSLLFPYSVLRFCSGSTSLASAAGPFVPPLPQWFLHNDAATISWTSPLKLDWFAYLFASFWLLDFSLAMMNQEREGGRAVLDVLASTPLEGTMDGPDCVWRQ
jgi:hypothetical protein